MCNAAVLDFFVKHAGPEDFQGKRVLEVGSRYVNGSARPFIERFFPPKEYIGIDTDPGRFVDLVLPAERIVEALGTEAFDAVVSTELVEHVMDWRRIIDNMKTVLKPGGSLFLTTRSFGFPYHGHRDDFWRFELTDFARIFDDFHIVSLEKDEAEPGVCLKARKPASYSDPKDLSEIALYSLVLGRKTTAIPSLRDMPWSRRLALRISDGILAPASLGIGRFTG